MYSYLISCILSTGGNCGRNRPISFSHQGSEVVVVGGGIKLRGCRCVDDVVEQRSEDGMSGNSGGRACSREAEGTGES